MINEARRLLEARSFEPFSVRTSDGREYHIPTTDHAKLNPRGSYLIIFDDTDSHATISALHLVAVIEHVKA